mmetsp:Transcript_40441/g.92892  ORF Transcript_40441/g.92892 Transcript_40441/m.92892 type:complete len:221 (-) Transcript_40441:2204-2866(-)
MVGCGSRISCSRQRIDWATAGERPAPFTPVSGISLIIMERSACTAPTGPQSRTGIRQPGCDTTTVSASAAAATMSPAVEPCACCDFCSSRPFMRRFEIPKMPPSSTRVLACCGDAATLVRVWSTSVTSTIESTEGSLRWRSTMSRSTSAPSPRWTIASWHAWCCEAALSTWTARVVSRMSPVVSMCATASTPEASSAVGWAPAVMVAKVVRAEARLASSP